jgi:hypothetical protein
MINRSTLILLAAASFLLSACGGSSSSTSGSSSNYVTETFITNSQIEIVPADITPGCAPDTESNLPLPEGILVYKKDELPTRLVVFAHGIGHTVEASWLPHMLREIRAAQLLENQPGSVAYVTTDYRDNLGFPALRGAHDLITATRYALEKFPSVETVYLMGVSMGGAVSGTAIVESIALSEDGNSLFDYWLDVEGVSQLTETYTEALAAGQLVGNETAQAATSGIERDTGGTPIECPLAYVRRSPALHAAEMMLGGLKAATVIHAVNDGLVTHDQGRQMAAALTTAGIPTQFFTIVGVEEWQDPGTTGTGTLGAGDLDPALNLAGHASEADPFHPVMATAFLNLRKMLDGTYNETLPYFECAIDPNLPSEACIVDQLQ